jgi:hypothetical protein
MEEEFPLAVWWPVLDPFELALFVGALTALANRHPAFFNEELDELAERCLTRWPARARC